MKNITKQCLKTLALTGCIVILVILYEIWYKNHMRTQVRNFPPNQPLRIAPSGLF